MDYKIGQKVHTRGDDAIVVSSTGGKYRVKRADGTVGTYDARDLVIIGKHLKGVFVPYRGAKKFGARYANKFLGMYETEEEAHEAWRRAAEAGDEAR